MLAPWKKSYDQPREHIKKKRHDFANKGSSRQSYGFSITSLWVIPMHQPQACCILHRT